MYLSYDEYQSMGGSVSEMAFTNLEYKARKKIDTATHGRIKDEEKPREAVKHLCFELISFYGTGAGAGMASASNDGVSVAFLSGEASAKQETNLIKQYLIGELCEDGTPVLYLGVK